MRIVVEKEKDTQGKVLAGGETKRKVTVGKEDWILLLVVVLILVGLYLDKLNFEQALAYIGVSTSGGVWGLLSGNATEK